MLLCESTFLSTEEHLADEHRHLLARQVARLAAEAGLRLLLLACDLDRIPFAPRP